MFSTYIEIFVLYIEFYVRFATHAVQGTSSTLFHYFFARVYVKIDLQRRLLDCGGGRILIIHFLKHFFATYSTILMSEIVICECRKVRKNILK